MASRQGGVHISYLIVAIVICLGLVGLLVIQNSALNTSKEVAQSLRSEVKGKEGKIKQQNLEVRQLRELIIGVEDQKAPYEDLKTLISKGGAELAQALDQQGSKTYRCFQDLYRDTFEAIRLQREQNESQRTAAEAKDSEYVQVVESKTNLSVQKNEEIARLRQEINDLQVQIERIRGEASDETARLRKEMEDHEEELTSRIGELDRDLWIKDNLLARANQRIDHLQREINKEKDLAMVDPDGRVLRVSEELGKGWINLGGKQRVRAGTIFNVFEYVKGGKRLQKARVEVAHVEEDYAEVRILEVLDRFNPVASGDYISSPFYNAADVPSFVIAGDKVASGRLSLEELRRKIEKFGGTVDDEVKLDTSYLVAVKGYETTPEYETARELGITILREAELIEFIEY
ncbi:MAG: BRCT domain-containing protein [Planctomycetota bacterium]